MRWINYQHLFYFWNVAKHGGVTQASQALRLAQPTISAQLKSFEETIGEKLFQRVGRHLQLTEEGQIAYRYADQIFSLGQELLEVLDGNTPSSIKELKIGISDVVPKSLAYRLIEPALDTPNVTSLCFEDKTDRLLADLAISQVDLVIADRPIPPNVKVKAYNHFIGECGVSFLATSRLCRKYSKNFPRSLNSAPILLPTEESAVRHELDLWFEAISIQPLCVGAFQDRALMKLAAREGKGIIPVPTVIENEVKNEFHLQLIGRTNQITEQIYIITTDRRLKQPLVIQICKNGKNNLFALKG